MPRLFVSLTLLILPILSSAEVPGWERTISILETNCLTCHDEDSAKGDVILSEIFDHDGKITHYKLWDRALRSVQGGEMPPKNKKQPSAEDREHLVTWIDGALDRMARENAGDPGIVTMRRLTNAEYNYTLRDLTHISKDYSAGFAPDGGGGEGFSNTGDVLFVSPEQLEKYLQVAREVAEHATIMPGSAIRFHKEPVGLRGPNLLKSQTEQTLRSWYRKQAAKWIPQDDEDLREADYLLACWKWKYRNVTQAASLEALAKEEDLDPAFLNNWWALLSTPQPPSRYVELTTKPFQALPKPNPAQPNHVPKPVLDQIASIAAQRKSWYAKRNQSFTVQRQQQDSSSVSTYRVEVELKGAKKAHLLVADLGDGNEGDIVHWSELSFQRADGSWHNLFDWMWVTARDGDAAAKKFFEPYLKLEWSHPTGREMKKQHFAVHAPSITTFPVPEGATKFSAKGRLEQDAPGNEKASAQWTAVAGERPQSVPPILPGVLTVWKRLTPTHYKLMGEFNRMKSQFPVNFDKRVFETENNFGRWDDKARCVYGLTNAQLFSRISPEERWWVDGRRNDWHYVWDVRKLSEQRKKEWDEKVIAHLRSFAYWAWRRPVTDAEFQPLQKLYRELRASDLDQESAAREVLVSILVSPNFLFRAEEARGESENTLNGWEFASRLSYFLWSSGPDGKLREDAKAGKLDRVHENWQVVCDHVDRMLSDWKSSALAREFVGQWLGFYDVQNLKTIDTEAFPTFNGDLRWSMHEETSQFVHDVIKSNRPVMDLVLAKDTFLNEHLARHYGIPGVKGTEFRKVDVSDHHRGGILGMASFHAKSSYPLRTSPVLRGHWVIAEVLGRPTPPPPPNVPEIPEGKDVEHLTLRERLVQHRQDPNCASCHDRIDPPGFALEKFDPIGRFRETDTAGRPIDDSGETREGTKFVGIEGLRQWLGTESEQFERHFCTKLVGYALGREVLASDQALIDEMMANMDKWNGSFGAAIKPLVLSRQFRSRRN